MERWIWAFRADADALEHQIKGGQFAEFCWRDGHGDLLEHAQHRAFAHRTVPALESIVLGQVLDGGLKQRELVRDERVAVDEVLPVAEVAVGLGAIGKVEQGLEVVDFPVVDSADRLDASLGFRQQAFLDDFRHVLAGQLHAVGEAVLDLGKVVALLLVHLADDRVHVLLGGDDDPSPPLALGRQALGDGLQVGHQLGVAGDVLAHFVDKEVQPEVLVRLLADVGVDLFGEVFDRDFVVGLVAVEDALDSLAGDLLVGLVDLVVEASSPARAPIPSRGAPGLQRPP